MNTDRSFGVLGKLIAPSINRPLLMELTAHQFSHPVNYRSVKKDGSCNDWVEPKLRLGRKSLPMSSALRQ